MFTTIIPKSVIDSLPIKLEEPELDIDEPQENAKPKQKTDSPPKVKAPASIARRDSHGSSMAAADGQWVRKDESDVGDGVKVKAERQPEIQGCGADDELYSENVVVIKDEPIDDSYETVTENNSRFSSDTSDRSTFNIKEEPLDIIHENVSQDSSNTAAKEVYLEEVNYDIVKKEVLEEDELERQLNENFVKCESAFVDDNDNNHSKNTVQKPNEKPHKCPSCLKTYKNKCHLSRHMNYECPMRHKDAKARFKCPDCHVPFSSKAAMERHYGSKHAKQGERTSCDACCRTFRDEKTLKRHLERLMCNGTPTNSFVCPNCHKEYRHATSVWRHKTYECERVPRFGCAHCDYMTLQKGNIAKHFRRKHADENERTIYKCPKCGRTYKNEYTMKRHVDVECGKEPAFSCGYCEFKTKRKYSLHSHIKNRH